jgi:predicted enzyme involved in methoxymalonyl-ACP biosynthesis
MSIGRFQIFLNTPCLSGVKCLSDESCSSVDTQVSGGGAAIPLALRLRDKFGEQGIVALLLAIPGAGEGTLKVDSFLVSCRALGRGAEDVLWTTVVNRAHREKARRLEAEYRATPKNGMVANLYERFGLQCLRKNGSTARYQLEPVEPRDFPSWIVVKEKKG